MKKDFIIRPIKISDAKAYFNLRLQTERETEMMAYRAGERKETLEKFTDRLKRNIDSKFTKTFISEVEGSLVGFIIVYGEDMKVFSKNRGIALAVAKEQWGKGIGNALMTQGIKYAKKIKMHRIELEVLAHNKAAITLYRKFGFEKEGVKKEGALIEKKYVDVISMGLLLK